MLLALLKSYLSWCCRTMIKKFIVTCGNSKVSPRLGSHPILFRYLKIGIYDNLIRSTCNLTLDMLPKKIS